MGVDGGKTGLRLSLADGGATTATSTADGFLHRAGVDPVETLLASIRTGWERLGSPGGLDSIGLGLTGAPPDRARLADLAQGVGRLTGARLVRVGGDNATSHLGALAGADGVVVAAGSGVITMAASGERQHRVDGWGYVLGDDGGGYSLGRAGLVRAFSTYDGRTSDGSELMRRAMTRYESPQRLVAELYVSPTMVADVASFALEVIAAAKEADPAAMGLCADAAECLAETAIAAIRILDWPAPPKVSWTGKLFNAGSVLLDPFAKAISKAVPDAVFVPPIGDGLSGAIRLASLGRLGPWGTWVVEWAAP